MSETVCEYRIYPFCKQHAVVIKQNTNVHARFVLTVPEKMGRNDVQLYAHIVKS